MCFSTAAIQEACESVHHDAICQSLRKKSQSVCRASTLLVKLYDGHTAAVLTDVERVKSFRISGSTKQRDSLPSLSCHSVRKSSMESDTRSWWEKGFGIEMGDHKKSCTSNVTFAVDALLMVNSLRQPKNMMTYTRRSTEEGGLEIH